MTAIIYSGTLECLPNLKIVIGEAGIGWIPYVLERLDYEWEDQFKDLELTMKPSEYWYRQMYATYQQDQTGIDLIEKVGVNNVMWGSDFPHPDGVWPDSQEFLHKQLGHLPEATRRKIVYENAAKRYGVPITN
jgi:predicted TIM-barrel fold metal-dependent hydrolase